MNIWKQNYRLDRMNMQDLTVAFFMHFSIQVYLAIAFIMALISIQMANGIIPVLLSILSVLVIYPFAWYLIHRFILHGRFLYKFKSTAKIWKRIHFDHHRDPHDLHVLFGALHTTLPTIALVSAPVGYLISSISGACAAFAAGLIVTCFYEFCHCVQHLGTAPKSKILKRMKRLHLQHHFHDEKANYGITNFGPDKLFGTYVESPINLPQSPTVFNLGYTGLEVKKYPWVAQLTNDIDPHDAIKNGIVRRKPSKA